jgi:hypothetical protein
VNEPASTLGQRTSLARALSLVQACDGEQRRLFELKSARLYAFGVFVSYALLMLVVRGREQRLVLGNLTHDALVTLTYSVGTLSALGAARGFSRSQQWQPLRALAAQRGHAPAALAQARLLASAYRSTLLLGSPALALVLLAWACGTSAGFTVTTGTALVLYALLTGLLLAGLARLAAWLSPRHARAWLLLLGAGPLLIGLGFPWFPSLPGGLSWALERIAQLGARFP